MPKIYLQSDYADEAIKEAGSQAVKKDKLGFYTVADSVSENADGDDSDNDDDEEEFPTASESDIDKITVPANTKLAEYSPGLIGVVKDQLDDCTDSDVLEVCRAVEAIYEADEEISLPDRVATVAAKHNLSYCQQELFRAAQWVEGEDIEADDQQ